MRRAVFVPVGQAVRPQLGLLRGEGLGGEAVARRVGGVDPRREVTRREIGKRQQQVREVALRIDGEHRHAVDGRFLDQSDAEAGLAAAGHAHADRVRDEVLRVVEHEPGAPRAGGQVVLLAQIEDAQLLVVRHRHAPIICAATCGVVHVTAGKAAIIAEWPGSRRSIPRSAACSARRSASSACASKARRFRSTSTSCTTSSIAAA